MNGEHVIADHRSHTERMRARQEGADERRVVSANNTAQRNLDIARQAVARGNAADERAKQKIVNDAKRRAKIYKNWKKKKQSRPPKPTRKKTI